MFLGFSICAVLESGIYRRYAELMGTECRRPRFISEIRRPRFHTISEIRVLFTVRSGHFSSPERCFPIEIFHSREAF